MSEEVQNQNPEPEVVLPSEESAKPNFEEYLQANTSENGKLFGRFDDVTAALDHFREQEIKHTNNMREIKESQKQLTQQQEEEQANAQAEAERISKINELVPKMLENNMQVTPEMMSVMEESGLSQAEVELGAYKVREITNMAYQIYGGRENFEQVKSWAEENLDDATKQAFDMNLADMVKGNTGVGVLAMEGLLARYNKANQGEEPKQYNRVEGSQVPRQTNVGYKSQSEMIKDRRAAEKNPTLMKAYMNKLSKTPDSVVYGY